MNDDNGNWMKKPRWDIGPVTKECSECGRQAFPTDKDKEDYAVMSMLEGAGTIGGVFVDGIGHVWHSFNGFITVWVPQREGDRCTCN